MQNDTGNFLLAVIAGTLLFGSSTMITGFEVAIGIGAALAVLGLALLLLLTALRAAGRAIEALWNKPWLWNSIFGVIALIVPVAAFMNLQINETARGIGALACLLSAIFVFASVRRDAFREI